MKFFIFKKFSYNFVLLIFISIIEFEDSFTSHKHLAFWLLLSYSEKSQSSWQMVLLLSINSFFLSFNIISVPLFDVVG